MKKIIIWKGHHSTFIYNLIEEVYYSKDILLILCPPRIHDLSSWIPSLPEGIIEFVGDFAGRPPVEHRTTHKVYRVWPKFGLFSTGTENGTKLILYTNENFKASLEGIFSFFEHLKITAVFPYPMPYHVFGLSLAYLYSLIFNKKLIIPKGPYSREFHLCWQQTTHEEGKGLLTLGTPTHFIDLIAFSSTSFPSDSLTCIIGGARVEKKIWQQIQEKLKIAHPSIGYGCSEASPGITHLGPGLIPKTDADIGCVLPNGKITSFENNFFYEGPNVCLAILQKEDLIFPQGKIKLDDSLRPNKEKEGYFFYNNRNGLILNRGGEKFLLEEIETIIQEKLLQKVIAVSVEDSRLGFDLGLVFEGDVDKTQILQLLAAIYSKNFNPNYIKKIETIPINKNGKEDRHFCSQYILKEEKKIKVETLIEYLPHRAPMIWIDFILNTSENGGECLVECKKEEHYFSKTGIRQSVLVEWSAQAYGFISAYEARKSSNQQVLEKAFLVGIDHFVFEKSVPKVGEFVVINIKKRRVIGPISYIEALIYSKNTGEIFAKGTLKLFSA